MRAGEKAGSERAREQGSKKAGIKGAGFGRGFATDLISRKIVGGISWG